MENFRGEGSTEDWISMFSTQGQISNYIEISNNYARGGGPSNSGGGFIAGDGDGQYVVIENNKLYNPGNYIVAAAGGDNIIVRNNMGYQADNEIQNIATYAYLTNASSHCNSITMTGNSMLLQNSNNYYCYCTPTCGDVIGVDESQGDPTNGWLQTNSNTLTLAQLNFPATIIDFVSADRLWHLRDESQQFSSEWTTGSCYDGEAQYPRPTSNAGADQNRTVSTATLSGSGSTSTDGFNYRWVQVSGPNTAVMSAPLAVTNNLSGLSTGTYEFRLEVTNNSGAGDADWVTINVTVGTTYYVSPTGNNGNNGTSTGTPWQTIAKVNSMTFGEGDRILFKRGGTFTGNIVVSNSGTAANPITYGNYDSGNIPEITNGGTFWDASITATGKQYIVIDGFKIIDNTMNPSDHSITANFAYGIDLNNSPNITIQNCNISLIGIGIRAEGTSTNTTITANTITNLRMVVNTVGGDDDYGANAIILGTSNNTVTRNTISECWAISNDYGYDGGAVEFYGTTMNSNTIMFNTATNCNGFMEIGSGTSGVANNNIVAYNKMINCGIAGFFQNSGAFAVTISNLQYYNNTIVETLEQYSDPGVIFDMQSAGTSGMLIVKNNIFYTSNNTNIYTSEFAGSVTTHTNNYYRMTNGAVGITLTGSETLSASATLFITTSGDPSTWNLGVANGAPTINFGVPVGYSVDFAGVTISGNPDAGVYEYVAY